MQKGKYRIIIQKTTEILITITDEDLFRQDFEAWRDMLGPDRQEEVNEQDFLQSRARKRGNGRYDRGLTSNIENKHLHIETIRTCRHCGCTDENACILEDANGNTRTCTWYAHKVCDNPACIEKAALEAEKETEK